MVLQGLADSLSRAFQNLRRNLTIDEEAINAMLGEIETALQQADMPTRLIDRLKRNLRTQLLSEDFQKYAHKQSVIRHWVYMELVKLLDPGVEAFKPQKGRVNVLMFVGLQGSGKTTTIAKYAHYYKRRKWRCALVCADTFRAGAFDQLKQNATKIGCPFYGSHTETDPVRLAVDGVEQFRQEGFELILVDTSGRHKQETSLFQEMAQIEETIQPNDIVFLMDGTIGQAAYDQAEAFKETVNVGSCIITKLDGTNSKGGGALAAVAATNSPITFIGYGEHFNDLEEFEPQGFAARLLGFGDPRGLLKKLQSSELAMDAKKQKQMLDRMMKGTFTLRDMHEQLTAIMKMGPISEVMNLISPQLARMLQGQDIEVVFRKYLTIMDSMTADELDTPSFHLLGRNPRRVRRLALGSGCSLAQVGQLFSLYKEFKKMFGQLSKRVNLREMARHQDDPEAMMRMLRGVVPNMTGRSANRMQQMYRQMQAMGGAPKGMRVRRM